LQDLIDWLRTRKSKKAQIRMAERRHFLKKWASQLEKSEERKKESVK